MKSNGALALTLKIDMPFSSSWPQSDKHPHQVPNHIKSFRIHKQGSFCKGSFTSTVLGEVAICAPTPPETIQSHSESAKRCTRRQPGLWSPSPCCLSARSNNSALATFPNLSKQRDRLLTGFQAEELLETLVPGHTTVGPKVNGSYR